MSASSPNAESSSRQAVIDFRDSASLKSQFNVAIAPQESMYVPEIAVAVVGATAARQELSLIRRASGQVADSGHVRADRRTDTRGTGVV